MKRELFTPLVAEIKMSKPTVVFAHGLEGSPKGTKSRFLKKEFDAVCVDMQGMSFLDRVRTFERVCQSIEGPLVLVGSSMGAAVVAASAANSMLIDRIRACILLAVPNAHDYMPDRLVDVPTVILHGACDDLFSPEGNQRFIVGMSDCQYHIVEDGAHNLSRPEDLQRLREAIDCFVHLK